MTYTLDYISRNGEDVRAVRRIVRALKAAGNPVVAVDDGAVNRCDTEKDILYHALGVDGVAALITVNGARVYVMGGQGGMDDTLVDYSVSLSRILADLA